MEIDITYKAKDGMEFSDPYLCEQYEKNLDKAPGTVGYFLEAKIGRASCRERV